tara:strand:- start:709 stop:1161 length:453 start_codon:yes stop_codon:yes gene_type:complete
MTRRRRTQLNSTINEFIDDFCEQHNITITSLQSKTKRRDVADKRKMLSYFLRNKVGLTFEEVGKIMKKDHSTIVFHVKSVEDFLLYDKYFKILYNNVDKIYQKYTDNLKNDLDVLQDLVLDNERLKRKLKRVETNMEMLNEKLYNEAGAV